MRSIGISRAIAWASLLAFASTPSILVDAANADELVKGVRFSDGTHLRAPDAVWDIDGMREQVQDAIENMNVLKPLVPRAREVDSVWRSTAILVDNPKARAVEDICDQYVSHVLAPPIQLLHNRIEFLELTLTDKKNKYMDSCEYYIREQRFPADIKNRFRNIVVSDFELTIRIADNEAHLHYLYETSKPGINGPIHSYLVKVPQDSVLSVDYLRDVQQIAKWLFENESKLTQAILIYGQIRENARKSARRPVRKIYALRAQNGTIDLVEDVSLLVENRLEKGVGVRRVVFVEVEILSPILMENFFRDSKNKNNPAHNAPMDDRFAQELWRLFDQLGAPLATLFDVEQIKLRSHFRNLETGFGIHWPAVFQYKEGAWELINGPARPG